MSAKWGAAALILLIPGCTSRLSQETDGSAATSAVGHETTVAASVLTTTSTTLSTTTTESTTTVSEPPEPLPNGSFGIAVSEGSALRIFEVEQSLGHKFDIVRWFARWDTPIPNEDLNELIRTQHAIHLSVRPRKTSGEDILWSDIAASHPGDGLYRQMEDIIDNVAAIGSNVYFTFNHEAETRDSAPNGTAQEFIAAWRVFYGILRERTGPLTDPNDPDQIAAVYTVGNSGFLDGRAEEFYPGDDYVDVVGVDVYNWHKCQGSDREWIQMEELLAPGLAFARARKKPLAIPEFGSVEDSADPYRKGEWMRQAAVTLNSPELADALLFSAWFDVTAPGGAWPNCVWDHDSSFETFLGFEELLGATAKNG